MAAELSSTIPLKQIVRRTVQVSSSLSNGTNETTLQCFMSWVPIVPDCRCTFTAFQLQCRRLESLVRNF